MYTATGNSSLNDTANGCPIYDESVATQFAKTLAYCIIIILSLVGNSIVIFTVWRNSRMRSVTNLFIGNLAASDLLITFLAMPNMITQLFVGPKWMFGSAICKIVVYFQSVSVASSVLTLLTISFDRFWAIVFPFKRSLTFCSARFILGVTWVISLGIAAPFLYAQRVIISPEGHAVCVEDWRPLFDPIAAPRDYTVVLFVALYVLPLLTMTLMYAIIASRLWRRQIPGVRSNLNQIRTRESRKKVVKMLMIVIILFCACWFPIYVYQFILFFESKEDIPCFDSSYVFYFTSLFLGHANSAINPYLYALFHRKYRQGFKAACTCTTLPAPTAFSRTYSRRRTYSSASWFLRYNHFGAASANKRKISVAMAMNRITRNFAPKKRCKDPNASATRVPVKEG